MPKKTLYTYRVERLAILNEKGQADPLLEPKISPEKLKKMFKDMLLVRQFDLRAISMQRQGRMGPYAAAHGQEAIHIGSTGPLEKSDWAVPCFREQGVYLTRGITPKLLLLYFMGSEEGNRFPKELHTLPFCVPCGSQILHAVGIGMAAKIKNDPIAVTTFFGDGSTSEGDFHEGLNFASVFRTPTVFVCQNNQWAISTPLKKQTHSPTLAQKAIAYGMDGLQVDGNDVLAVYVAMKEALHRARQGRGPTLLECLTYRVGAHTTSDDPGRYRSEEEVKTWLQKDPIDRFEKYLLNKGILQEGERKNIELNLAEYLKAEADAAEEITGQLTPDEMFNYLYQNFPDILKPQLNEVWEQYAQKNQDEVVHE